MDTTMVVIWIVAVSSLAISLFLLLIRATKKEENYEGFDKNPPGFNKTKQ